MAVVQRRLTVQWEAVIYPILIEIKDIMCDVLNAKLSVDLAVFDAGDFNLLQCVCQA